MRLSIVCWQEFKDLLEAPFPSSLYRSLKFSVSFHWEILGYFLTLLFFLHLKNNNVISMWRELQSTGTWKSTKPCGFRRKGNQCHWQCNKNSSPPLYSPFTFSKSFHHIMVFSYINIINYGTQKLRSPHVPVHWITRESNLTKLKSQMDFSFDHSSKRSVSSVAINEGGGRLALNKTISLSKWSLRAVPGPRPREAGRPWVLSWLALPRPPLCPPLWEH